MSASIAVLVALAALAQAVPRSEAPPAVQVRDVARLSAATSNEQRFDALTAMLQERKLPFTAEPFTIDKPIGREPRTQGRNVIVTLGAGAEDLVIGAHYDAARLADGTLSQGAVDNAASSVMLVRLAEALRGSQLPYRVRIVWFDMEELGLIGSARYLQQHASDRIAAMLNFDVNGYGDTVLFGPSQRTENSRVRRALVETCAAVEIPCVAYPQMPPGDDRSFVKAGIPTVSIAALPALEAHQLWLMMNGGARSGLAEGSVPAILQTIHTAADTPDKLDETTMTTMLKFAAALVRNVARTP